MEQKLIIKNDRQCIYFMKESNLEFYLVIPNCKKVKIVLGLFSGVNDNFVKDLLIQNDRALVIPVIRTDILGQANVIQSSSYNYLEQVLSFLINTSYKILTYNHIEVDQQILLNNSSLLGIFQQSFVNKYQGRVQLIDLFPEEKKESIVSAQKEVKQEVGLQMNMENVIPTEMPVEEKPVLREAREPGFVSYVLLGVVVAVVSLVFLYLII